MIRLNQISVFLLMALTLGACFDLEQQVRIYRDGSGEIKARMIMAPGREPDRPISGLLGLYGRAITTKDDWVAGTFVHEETARFSSLNDLTLPYDEIELSSAKTWTFGVWRVDLARVFYRPFPFDREIRQFTAPLFAGHTYTFTFILPGTVERAGVLRVGGKIIDPAFRRTAASGTYVSWTVPLELLAYEEQLNFDVTFKGIFATPWRARTRAPRG